MPIVVDNIFSDDFIKKNKLDLSLLEEIVSSVSYKTYVFLDTMSTSYETGLFTNHFANDNVTIFLEKDYLKRQNNRIGEFIQKSNQNIRTYSAKKDANGYISFCGSDEQEEPPDEIKSVIDKDSDCVTVTESHVVFRHLDNENLKFCEFGWLIDKANRLVFSCSIKTLFYYLGYISKNNRENALEDYVNKMKNDLFSLFLSSSSDIKFVTKTALSVPEITMAVSGFDFDKLALHILKMFSQISKVSENKKNVMSVIWDDKMYFNPSVSISVNLLSIVSDYPNKTEKMLVNYKNRPSDFVKKITLTVNGKKRSIITYSSNKNGKELREYHTSLVKAFSEYFSPSPFSFSYSKNCDVKKCLQKHLLSASFEKLDIHHFFESIRFKACSNLLIEKIKGLNDSSPIKFGTNSEIKAIFGGCFYHGYLPIGFCSSPFLSEFFMFSFDADVGRTANSSSIIYTRYADDMLVSSPIENRNTIKPVLDEIKRQLSVRKLALNENKRLSMTLYNEGDSIKFLGATITRNKGGINRIGISRKRLLKISKLFQYAARHKNRKMLNKAFAEALYVRHISDESYVRLGKIIMIKTGFSFQDFQRMNID